MEENDLVKATIMGRPFVVKGLGALVVVVLALALGGIGFMFWDRTNRSDIQRTQEHEGILHGLLEIQGVNQKISELIDEQNYIVLSDDKERQEMKKKLRRPSSLSRKLEQ